MYYCYTPTKLRVGGKILVYRSPENSLSVAYYPEDTPWTKPGEQSGDQYSFRVKSLKNVGR